MQFEWDREKAKRNLRKHKVPFEEAMTVGANVVMLEPDVAKSFVDSDAVNEALRSLLDLTKTTQRLTKHSSGRGQ